MPGHTQPHFETFHETTKGRVILGDSLDVLATYSGTSVDLIMTSPPFGLVRKKDYGNVAADKYVEWFKPFASAFHHVLKDSGSLVIDIGGAWKKGQPTRSLYHFKLLIMLCEEFGFHLAQEFYWWNPSKLPTPAEWVTVRRVRVKDAVNTVWWLSKTPWPKASNRRVLQPYSPSMKELLVKGYRAKKRPSGHDISTKFSTDNGAAIPPNLIAIPNTESNSFYLRYCESNGLKPHPARYPADLPEYFIRMLTERGDLVVDPFAGSCVTGEVCERTDRQWVCIELVREYCEAALGRFVQNDRVPHHGTKSSSDPTSSSNYYRLPRPGILWNERDDEPLAHDGGKERPGKYHYVSDFVLSNFAGDDELLQIMSKRTGRIWEKGPREKRGPSRRRAGYDAFAENKYYPKTVEKALHNVESDAAPVIKKIIVSARTGELTRLECQEKRSLCDFLLVQILRTPRMKEIVRTHVNDFPEGEQNMMEVLLAICEKSQIDGVQFDERMAAMSIDVGVTDPGDGASFVIGDVPCVFNGDLTELGHIVTMPVARDVYIQLTRPEESQGELYTVSADEVQDLNIQAYKYATKFVAGPDRALLERLSNK